MRHAANEPRTARARESLRKRFRPSRVKILFVGESPPASGRFFYQADSGLYRAIRDCFRQAFPELDATSFLIAFRELDCYLVDLCGQPVDRLTKARRRNYCHAGEARLAGMLRRLRPEIVVTLVKSIAANVRRAAAQAEWPGEPIEVPYPGRWHRHRAEFTRILLPVLRASIAAKPAARIHARPRA